MIGVDAEYTVHQTLVLIKERAQLRDRSLKEG